jgi:benzylsuccinate CoA-transferase BbsE subunit
MKGAGFPRADGTVIESRAFYPCKDGWIFMLLGGGALKALSLSGKALIELMDEEGMAGDLKDYDWATYDAATITQEEIDHQQLDIIGPYFKTKTKLEFYEEAIRRKILGCPFQDPKDLAESPQLAARDFFVDIEHPELNDTITHCGPFIKLSETPLKKWRRAPLMGEHNLEIYEQELGYTAEQLHGLNQAGVI